MKKMKLHRQTGKEAQHRRKGTQAIEQTEKGKKVGNGTKSREGCV
jgi:hypothetical protein